MAYAGPLTPAEARGMPPLDGQRREAHKVTIAEPFYLGVTEVTQKQYQEVMGSNPSKFSAENGGGPDFPVEQVTWDEAAEFCRKLPALPTEKSAPPPFASLNLDGLLSITSWYCFCVTL